MRRDRPTTSSPSQQNGSARFWLLAACLCCMIRRLLVIRCTAPHTSATLPAYRPMERSGTCRAAYTLRPGDLRAAGPIRQAGEPGKGAARRFVPPRHPPLSPPPLHTNTVPPPLRRTSQAELLALLEKHTVDSMLPQEWETLTSIDGLSQMVQYDSINYPEFLYVFALP